MFIYLITNKINGKRYVGQTTGLIEDRFKKHINASFSNNKKYAINQAIIKYGKENFEIKKICKCNNIKEMNHREEYYIKILNTLTPNGYNLKSGGNNSKPSEESRKKMSISHMGKRQTEESKIKKSIATKGIINIKKIVCLTTQESFNSLTEAAEKYGLSVSKISSVCKLNRYSTGGLVFRYVGQENLIYKKNKRGPKKGNIPPNRKAIELIELNKVFQCISEAVKYCLKLGKNTNRASIRRVAQGKYMTAAGFTWRFI